MSKRESIIVLILTVLVAAFFTIMLNSCSGIKHYKYVAKDNNITKKKKDILAPVAARLFPVIPTKVEESTSKDTVYRADTTGYSLLRRMIKQLQWQLQQKPECPQIDADSLESEIRKNIKPDTIRYYTTKYSKETVLDSAVMQIAQSNYERLLSKYDSLFSKSEKYKEERDTLTKGTKSNKQLFIWLLKKNWLLLSIIVGLFVAYKLLKARFTLPF